MSWMREKEDGLDWVTSNRREPIHSYLHLRQK